MIWLSGCGCHLAGARGAEGFTEACNEIGECYCDDSLGYTGDKCDECLDGWYWSNTDRTCTSKE